ncbi:DUF3472 domain-containing protein [Burkholderia ubonensis]|nr:DUF3472 domain-containing protein [Burkholderia ubonensis]MDY7791325.1 DUF3472 domain-containing protein [Burkholderia ubonensis]
MHRDCGIDAHAAHRVRSTRLYRGIDPRQPLPVRRRNRQGNAAARQHRHRARRCRPDDRHARRLHGGRLDEQRVRRRARRQRRHGHALRRDGASRRRLYVHVYDPRAARRIAAAAGRAQFQHHGEHRSKPRDTVVQQRADAQGFPRRDAGAVQQYVVPVDGAQRRDPRPVHHAADRPRPELERVLVEPGQLAARLHRPAVDRTGVGHRRRRQAIPVQPVGRDRREARHPASAGIGAGSYCTVSGSATDGSAGAQCRYRYEWQAGHTYRFRITPDANQGPGWFKSNVTDVTNGTTGDSFDIGSIYVGTTQTQVPVSSISQWVEYFDWNSSRTSCASVAYTNAQFSVRAYDALGNAVTVPAPSVTVNKTCPASYASASASNGVATLIGGPQQSAVGLVKANGACLTATSGLRDGSPAALGACPTLASVRASGGTHFNPQLWVAAGDGTLQTKSSYCLTAPAPGAASGALLRTCVPGEADQQWQVTAGSQPGTAQLVSLPSGRCLAPAGSTLGLQPCTAATAVWATPGKSFAY